MTGKSQAEAVAILRNTQTGQTVDLVVSRQVEEFLKLPRELVRAYLQRHRGSVTFKLLTIYELLLYSD